MTYKLTHIDHIDPTWAEGRDYQLVCGLPVVYNMTEREPSLNMSKANRFLPWRNSRDELGEEPRNPGDLCLFLDPDTNEWVLEEFMGKWWFEKSKRTDGKSASQKGRAKSEGCRKRQSKAQMGRVITEETRQKMKNAHTGRVHSPETRAKMTQGNIRRHSRTRLRHMSLSDPQCPDFED